ncbi:LuxR C-terminal-related transcriptional regulator, partial [Escherichia coli]|uniref:LuxR C-terminal-related transcriptional regulator n=1 Tax=Escherichia coli TaxID=562 RepID=UPI001FF2F02D
ADRNRSHWSTSKTPSYTKSVSWQHHLLSNKTVSAHKSNIYGKLGLHSIVELIDYAKLYELI